LRVEAWRLKEQTRYRPRLNSYQWTDSDQIVQKLTPKPVLLGDKSVANCHLKRVEKQGKFLAFCCMNNQHNPLIYKNLGVVKQKRQGIV